MGPDNSLLYGIGLCTVECLAASKASTHQMPIETSPLLPPPPQLWQPKLSPDIANCPLGGCKNTPIENWEPLLYGKGELDFLKLSCSPQYLFNSSLILSFRKIITLAHQFGVLRVKWYNVCKISSTEKDTLLNICWFWIYVWLGQTYGHIVFKSSKEEHVHLLPVFPSLYFLSGVTELLFIPWATGFILWGSYV